MPTSRRSNRRPYQSGHIPLDDIRARGGVRQELRGGAKWMVRSVISEKAYRCPGCHQLLNPGVNHVVVWQADSWQGDANAIADRRHWHTGCWKQR